MNSLRFLLRAMMAFCCALAATPAFAHENQPIVIDLREVTPGQFALQTQLSRHPALVAAGFGTLHGLGFAGALAEIGLARTSVTLSLVGFNLGVEIGQAAFVLLVFGLMMATRRLGARFNASSYPSVRTATISAIGVAASFWFWERGFALFV